MKHLTLCQRYKIEALLALNFNKSQIADQVHVHRATIGRELKRNSFKHNFYDADLAHKLYVASKQQAGSSPKKPVYKIQQEIKKRLELQFSPEQICGQLQLEQKSRLSHTSIYKLIWEDKKNGGFLFKNLRQSGKKKRKKYGSLKGNRGTIKNRVSIEQRPKIVDQLKRIGDWEADTIIGKNHKSVMVSLTERRSMFQLLKKVKNKSAKQVSKAIIKMINTSNLPAHTITFDNGKEFAGHEIIAKSLNLKTYFAHPYSSWERGLNENQNGLVRQYFPKKTDFQKISHQQIKKVQDLLNIRPRKSIDFYSPIQFVNNEIGVEINCRFDSG
jgi:IS30 family transposase